MKYDWKNMTEGQKVKAVMQELKQITHNATTKDDLLNILRWLWDKFEVESVKKMPEIVCLCGPLRFMEAFRQAEYGLEMQGKIVVAPSFLPGAAKHDGLTGCTPEEKIMLDELHKRKLDLCDTVFVLNVDGYIGESTRSEIEYAERIGKPIKYLFPEVV